MFGIQQKDEGKGQRWYRSWLRPKSLQKRLAVELISVHVPKTAGTTFQRILTQQYRKAVYLDYEPGPIRPQLPEQDWESWRSEKARKAAELPRETKVIHGHFWAGKYDHIFPGVRKITWLRDPVRRLISHYYYFKSNPSIDHPINALLKEKELSLLEFARLPQLQNVVTLRWLRDIPLSAFYFVGIQEHFDQDLQRLQRQLGWNPLGLATENRTVHPEYESLKIDSTILREMERLNEADVELYHQALALRPR